MRVVASFYRFFPVDSPDVFAAELRARLVEHGALGRVYVAHEGVNATLWADEAVVHALRDELNLPAGGDPVRIHIAPATTAPFRHLRVRARRTIVNLGLDDDVIPHVEGGEHLAPQAFADELARGGAVVLDVRNGYEARVGRFEGAIPAPFENFHEFPEWVASLDLPQDARILTYCTGGIRCEKFTGLLRRHGYENVAQLDGGILRYLDEVGGTHFQGEIVVFDDRISVPGGAGPSPDASCDRCGADGGVLVNCANTDCHRRVLLCPVCLESKQGTCSDPCLDAPRLRRAPRVEPDGPRAFAAFGIEVTRRASSPRPSTGRDETSADRDLDPT